MKTRPQTCYDRATLQQYLQAGAEGSGEFPTDADGFAPWERSAVSMSEHEEALVSEHLSECPSCRRQLEELSGGQPLCAELPDLLAVECQPQHAETWEAGTELPVHDVESVRRLLGPTDEPRSLGRLGPFEVLGIIGRGSTGIVVKAMDVRLHRLVAIKMLAPVYSDNGSARRRFEREGRSIASVKDDHVVPVYTVDEYRGLPYIVMQYVPDGSLWQRIQRFGALQPAEVVCVALQIARGLAAAHDRGIVHRDVKPANVLLESGVERAMVTDFGLARVVDETTMTRSGAISGTPQYMSPEQARGASIDQRSDLFSLGSVMFAACTGRPPFQAETVFGVIKQVVDAPTPSIREINPDIPLWLEALIAKLQQKDPDQRFQSAHEVAELLEQELAHLQAPTLMPQPIRQWMPAAAGPVQRIRQLWRRRKRSLSPVLGSLVLGGLLWTTWHLGALSAQSEDSGSNVWNGVGLTHQATGVPALEGTHVDPCGNPVAVPPQLAASMQSESVPAPLTTVMQTVIGSNGQPLTQVTCDSQWSFDAALPMEIQGQSILVYKDGRQIVDWDTVDVPAVVQPGEHSDEHWLALSTASPEIPAPPQLELDFSRAARPASQWREKQRLILETKDELARQLKELARTPKHQQDVESLQERLEAIEVKLEKWNESIDQEWAKWMPEEGRYEFRAIRCVEQDSDDEASESTQADGIGTTLIRRSEVDSNIRTYSQWQCEPGKVGNALPDADHQQGQM